MSLRFAMIDLVDKDVRDNSSTFMWVCKDVGCGRAMKNDNYHFEQSGVLWSSHIQVMQKGSA